MFTGIYPWLIKILTWIDVFVQESDEAVTIRPRLFMIKPWNRDYTDLQSVFRDLAVLYLYPIGKFSTENNCILSAITPTIDTVVLLLSLQNAKSWKLISEKLVFSTFKPKEYLVTEKLHMLYIKVFNISSNYHNFGICEFSPYLPSIYSTHYKKIRGSYECNLPRHSVDNFPLIPKDS